MSAKKKPTKAELARIDAIQEQDIDSSDIPDLTNDPTFWKNAKIIIPPNKVRLSARIDADVMAWFKSQGKGYQSKINAILRAYMQAKNS